MNFSEHVSLEIEHALLFCVSAPKRENNCLVDTTCLMLGVNYDPKLSERSPTCCAFAVDPAEQWTRLFDSSASSCRLRKKMVRGISDALALLADH